MSDTRHRQMVAGNRLIQTLPGRLPGWVRTGALVCLILACVCQSLAAAGWRLSLQTSGSMPRGWYLLGPVHGLRTGDLVIFRLGEAVGATPGFEAWAQSRWLILKKVAAVGGTHVCVRHNVLYLDRRPRAVLDGGTGYPRRAFCRRLREDEVLPLGLENAASFDGRYFGPIRTGSIRHKAYKL